MTVLQYLKQATKFELEIVAKLPIRELEQESPGHWVCYVDQYEQSHDVQLFLEGKKIQKFSCDCEMQEDICAHKFRMLLDLYPLLKGQKVQGSKPALKKVAKAKKVPHSIALLRSIDPQEIQGWLEQVFANNKELEQIFVLRFEPTVDKVYTKQEVEQLIKQVYNAVIGKKKKADAAQIKALVDMLTLVLEPVQKYIMMSLSRPEALDIAETIYGDVYAIKNKIHFTSKRLDVFLEKFTSVIAGYIYNLKDVNLVENLLDELHKRIIKEGFTIGEKSNFEIFFAFARIGKNKYKQKVLHITLALLTYFREQKYHIYVDLESFALHLVIDLGVFQQYYIHFSPILFDNKFNILLLEHLQEVDTELCKTYINTIISKNTKEVYNLPYIHILGDIYMQEGNLAGLAALQMRTFDHTCDFEDYLFIQTYMQGTIEFSRFRTRLLTNLNGSSYSNPYGSLLYFQILQSEFNYKKIFQELNNKIPHNVILFFASDLFKQDRELFLDKVLHLGQYYSVYFEMNPNLAYFLIENYSAKELKQGLKYRISTKESLNMFLSDLLKGQY